MRRRVAIRMFCQDILMTSANLLKFTPPRSPSCERGDRCHLRPVRAATMLLQSEPIRDVRLVVHAAQ